MPPKLVPLEDLSIVIAVLTFKRPEDLRSALPLLLEQADTSPVPARVLVIDNDPVGSAEETVESLGDARLQYVREPQPGIAAARNRALVEGADSSVLIFIDDDEVPSEHWLVDLLDTYRATQAAAVVGPVISEFAHDPEPWVASGDFFRRRRLATGTELTVAATNNLLLDLEQIRGLGLTFDNRFGLSGGSDTLFTRELVTRGGRMVWCDEAVVVDRVPTTRLTRDWVLRRSFRSGNGWSRVTLELAKTPLERWRGRLQLSGAGVIRLGGGLARSAVGVITRSQRHEAQGLRTAARGAGMLSGAAGYVYSEYKRQT